MDANGTRLHLVLGRADWGRCTGLAGERLGDRWDAAPDAPGNPCEAGRDDAGTLAWDAERNELTLHPCLFRLLGAGGERPVAPEDRRGAVRDRFGSWYFVDRTGARIQVVSAGTGRTTPFWPAPAGDGARDPGAFRDPDPAPPPEPEALGGLAVTAHHYLVAGTIGPAGFLLFDLHAGGPPRHLRWPEAPPLVPFDLAATPDGGVAVLDRANRRLWLLDRLLGVLSPAAPATPALDPFQPADGSAARRVSPPPTAAGRAIDLAAKDPIAVEALPDGSLLVLDRAPAAVWRYRGGAPVDGPVPADVAPLVADASPPPGPLVAHDFAFVPAHAVTDGTAAAGATVPERLYVAAAGGHQSFAFRVTLGDGVPLALEALPEFLPMRSFGGKGLVTAGDAAWYDFAETWVPLVGQRRSRWAKSGTAITPALDGRDPGCVWHRLLLDAHLAPPARVEVWSRAADELAHLSHTAWQEEPPLGRRASGPELAFADDRPPPGGTFELLFQRARGRWLQVKLRLAGDGRTTPRLFAIRVHYPRFSYLERYLPSVYRDDEASASFLDRFLANFEGLFTSIEDRIAAAQVLFDVRSAPSDVLDWLASWFGVALDPAWDEARRRFFIRHAMDFFRLRGTTRGLQAALHLVVGDCVDDAIFDEAPGPGEAIRILERFRVRMVPAAVFGDPSGTEGIRTVDAGPRWTPAEGGASLGARWRDFAAARGVVLDATYPIAPPADAATLAVWRAFSRAALGFVPAASAADLASWQAFLQRRYLKVDELDAVHGATWASFDDVGWPPALPADGPALVDWFAFAGLVVPIRRTAHRFTVLLPVPAQSAFDVAGHEARRALAERIVRLEKPAHALFDVRFYWAMFRVGEARLGYDTMLDVGSRAPELLPPLRLGAGVLSESMLAARPPQSAADRTILGRDELEARSTRSL